MAFSIAELDGKDDQEFRKKMLESINDFPGNDGLANKTLQNWRTEITALFSMVKSYGGYTFSTELSKELADTTNLKRFFLRFITTFQYPGGFLKNNEIEKLLVSHIHFHPLLWLSRFFTSLTIEKDDLYITDVEFCHCVINDLRVTRDHEDVSITIDRIINNRRSRIDYDSSGDIKRYALDILDYCVLSGLMQKDYAGKYFINKESENFFLCFKENTPLFNEYNQAKNLQDIELVKNSWIDFVNNKSKELILKLEKETSKEEKEKSNELVFNTKEIGDKGELLTLAHEKIWLINHGREDLSRNVKHMPTHFAVGYDILSREIDATMRHIEVKTTISKKEFTVNRIHLTPNEWSAAESHRERYFVYRLQISDENQSRKLWIIQDPVGLYKNNKIKMVPRNGADLYFNDECYKEVELLLL